MISSKMLFILLVLIYVTFSYKEDPEKDPISLKEAELNVKELVERKLNKVLSYGEEAKRNLTLLKGGRFFKNNFTELEKAFSDMAFVINTAANYYYKTERAALYNTLHKTFNNTHDDNKEKYEKVFQNAKKLLDAADKHWRKQWDAGIELLKYGVKLGLNPKIHKMVFHFEPPTTNEFYPAEVDKL